VPIVARRNADAPLSVEVPPAGADHPSWGAVGVITAIGFVVGVAWPRLAGVRLGPSVPEAPASAVAAPPSAALPPAVAAVPAPSQPAPQPPAPAPTALAAAPGTGQAAVEVSWEVAIIRDAPKTGKILARLPRGTTIHVGPAKDGWYPVKYGEGFASDGWVYRGAIGR